MSSTMSSIKIPPYEVNNHVSSPRSLRNEVTTSPMTDPQPASPSTTPSQCAANPVVSIVPDDALEAHASHSEYYQSPRFPNESSEGVASKGPLRKRLTSVEGDPKIDDEQKEFNEEEEEEKESEEPSLGYNIYSEESATDLGDLSAFPYASPSAKDPPFPVKLHRILANPQFSHIISWLPHGRSWKVLKPKAFEESVIPLFFRHCHYSSFMRQVNGWGFQRVYRGKDSNSYYHELFLRGLPHLCLKMRRPSGKQPALTAAVTARAPIPDFHAISEKHPLPEYKLSPEAEEVLRKDVERFSASAEMFKKHKNELVRQTQEAQALVEEHAQSLLLLQQPHPLETISHAALLSHHQAQLLRKQQEKEALLALQQQALREQNMQAELMRTQSLGASSLGSLRNPQLEHLSALRLLAQRSQLQQQQARQQQLVQQMQQGLLGGAAEHQTQVGVNNEVEQLRQALRASQVQKQLLAAAMAKSSLGQPRPF